jgi:hexosaminidase
MRSAILSLCGWFAALAVANDCLAEVAAPVSVEWRVLENTAENNYRAVLVLRNDSDAPLPAQWTLYFNSSSRLLPESVSPPFALEHVNGDFFALRPMAESTPVPPGESRRIEYTGSPWAINVSDAPSGFYWVAEDDAGNELPPVEVSRRIGSFPDAKLLTRGAGDQLPLQTAEVRFAENEAVALLPPGELPRVLPTPLQVTGLPGKVAIDSETVVVCDSALDRTAGFLVDALEPLVGRKLAVLGSSTEHAITIQLRIDPELKGSTGAYRLTIDPKTGIDIAGGDPTGVFYGVQTLRALVPIAAYRQPAEKVVLDALRIDDAPRFAYRGLHLDVARNFQSKKSVKKLLDAMAFYKLNRFHWHLTDDEGWRIEIKALPELTEVGGLRGHTRDEADRLLPSYGSGPKAVAPSAGSGFYTQDDFVEILRYAAERHIEVIPEIDLPGHARAAIEAMQARARRLKEEGNAAAAEESLLTEPTDTPQYESVQMWRDNVIDVGRESTYRFLDVIVGELAAMYERAGTPLKTLHLGGDEVPHGAWKKSPACAKIALDTESGLTRNQQLQLHFLDRAGAILEKRGIRPACWEDCLLFKDASGQITAESPRAKKLNPIVYVWNNVWGWGNEDAAYRLANAGFDVVLANATHLYLDLACEKDPEEVGYYWAGFVGNRKPFEFNPLDVFQNATANSLGQPMPAEQFANRVRLTDEGRRHILGLQGALWGENLRSAEALETMAFPRAIAVAERAWAAEPTWTAIANESQRSRELQVGWNRFANALGQRELPRLDVLFGGVAYRLPPPGAVFRDGAVHANAAFPGLTIRYTTDSSIPTASSPRYDSPVPTKAPVRLRTFDTSGRGSRTVKVDSFDAPR